MGLEGEGESGSNRREIFKMGLGLEGRTPGYMVREEVQRDKLEGRSGRRA